MSRALLILTNDVIRQRAINWVQKAPVGTRVEFKEAKRTNDQNALMWASLTEIATQKTHMGRKYTPDEWKAIFLHALGKETRFIPALDGQGFLPYGNSSSDLSTKEMSELMTLIFAWSAENGVTFNERAA